MRRLLIGSCLVLGIMLLTGLAAAGDDEEIAKLVAKLKESPNADRMRVEWGRLGYLVSMNKGKMKVLAGFVTDPKVAKVAAETLYGTVQFKPCPGAEDALPEVLKALRDPACAEARFPLLAFLGKIDLKGGKEVYDVLLEIIKDDGVKSGIKGPQLKIHRDVAIGALGNLGPSAKGATGIVCAVLKEAVADKRGGSEGTIRYAVSTLGRIDADPKEVLPLIRPLMEHESYLVVREANKAFLLLNKDPAETAKLIDGLLAICKDKKNRKRNLVFEEFKEMSPAAKGALPGLLVFLDDREDGRKVFDIIQKVGPAGKDIGPALLKRLEDKDRWPTQFVPTYYCLQKIGVEDKKLLPAVIAVLEDYASPESKHPIKGDRGQQFQLVGFDLIKKLGKDAAPAAKVLGAVAARCIKTKKGIYDMLKLSLECLRDIGPSAKDATADLQEIAKIKDPGLDFYRGLAAQALKNIEDPSSAKVTDTPKPGDRPKPGDTPKPADTPKVVEKRADPELLKGLGGKDDAAREKTVAKLLAMGADALPTLEEGLKADTAEARARAAGTLAKLKGKAKAAVPALIAALKDSSPQVRREAAAALAALGPDARDAEGALTDLLQDSDRETRLLAAYALEKLQAK